MNVLFLSNELRFSFCQPQAVICKSLLSYLVICFLVFYLCMGLNQPLTFYINYRFQYRYHKRGHRQHTILKFRNRFRQGFRGKLTISQVYLFFKQLFYLDYFQRSKWFFTKRWNTYCEQHAPPLVTLHPMLFAPQPLYSQRPRPPKHIPSDRQGPPMSAALLTGVSTNPYTSSL